MAYSIAEPRRARAALLALVAPAFAMSATPAYAAASPAEAALAQRLFDEARALFDAGNYVDACPKFAASQKLDPRQGTLMNLAICHERQGKTASAWTEFNDARGEARANGHADIDKVASEHIARLQPLLSHLKVVVSPNAHATGVTVKLDDATLDEIAWGNDLPIDPGPHVVQATAPGRMAWQSVTTVEGGGDHVTVEVPGLKPASPTAEAAPVVQTPADVAPSGGNARTLGFLVGGAGLASIAVGSVFGVLAIDKRGQVDSCTASACGANAQALNNQGVGDAWVSDIAIGVGIVGLAVGAYLVLTSKPDARPAATLPLVFTGRGVGFGTTF